MSHESTELGSSFYDDERVTLFGRKLSAEDIAARRQFDQKMAEEQWALKSYSRSRSPDCNQVKMKRPSTPHSPGHKVEKADSTPKSTQVGFNI